MAYGPDNNLPIDSGKTIKLNVPRYAEVKFTFSSDAAWENAICIYDSSYNKIIEKGNQAGRNLNPEIITRDRREERIIFITGWHKKGAANASLSWVQSPFRLSLTPGNNMGSGIVGFEDAGDGDYNDIVASYTFQ